MRPTLRLALTAAAMIVVVGTYDNSFAQTVQLYCPYSEAPGGGLVTIDYTARTLTADVVDVAGNVTKMAFSKMPAEITDDKISAIWRQSSDWQQFTLNRYTGIMSVTGSIAGNPDRTTVWKPCVPYRRGEKKF